MKRVEHGNSIAGDHRLAVDRERLGPQLPGGARDPRVSVGSRRTISR
jgi:hypothetical protein